MMVARRRANSAFDILDELYELAENERHDADEAVRRKIKSCARDLELHIRATGRLFIEEGSNQVMSRDKEIASTLKAEMERHKTEVLSALSTKLGNFLAQVKQEVQKLSNSTRIQQSRLFAEMLSEIRDEFHLEQPMAQPARVSKRKRQETDTQAATRDAPEVAMKEEPL
ncbi:uncharacterized protein TrAtP1_002834 [Trichoderma atroviride]|uniref:Uncharacterized protein n=1 Tax=Hypocrea atroviridis (strain ATCC 20476 / IMI 206040) TaxID=452589 RepID=G9NXA7_HYPAI|nr:uncharacterized protein TRIATDRAFT_88353 [Trichoderma atroviride IMI 206040]EHK44718.1 hypothetical protein TRIATDRAFT_88353 [Trichoderma atroviride IMI 206040]UKZ61575.1 hypothetical protein TrAtP1_002834 [Trichoderma atroviride]